ncbi:hypothetical protein PN499_03710 [Kamptonema animale CS-326]|jgi:hypothetical protein|uniref:hypothetical protein n=1 Tax=Kamptonema animale TaxID=92934 RepID=UPI00232FF4A9|nr:hypothetical protein [Kamptonema animale]MDB9510308.1 hypothetical protein [Kamptonema animale CS-326]
MLSQSPSVYIVGAALISGILTLVSSLLTTLINNKFQLEREKQQSLRQQESEQKKWYREKVYDSYITSIQVLTKMIQKKDEIDLRRMVHVDNFTTLRNLYFEFQAYFTIIIAGHPEKDSEDFKEQLNNINKYIQEAPLIVRHIVTNLMEQDSRIKGLNK